VGGGISSAIARALGGSRGADANALVVHAVVIALGFGLTFTLAALGAGRWLYGVMGAEGAIAGCRLDLLPLDLRRRRADLAFQFPGVGHPRDWDMTLPAVVTLSVRRS